MIVCGPSGTGKTVLVLKLLIEYLDFENLIIVSPSLDSQEEYQVFIRGLQNGLTREQIKHIFRNQDQIEGPLVDFVNLVVRRNRFAKEQIDIVII
jgi:uridine kinase